MVVVRGSFVACPLSLQIRRSGYEPVNRRVLWGGHEDRHGFGRLLVRNERETKASDEKVEARISHRSSIQFRRGSKLLFPISAQGAAQIHTSQVKVPLPAFILAGECEGI